MKGIQLKAKLVELDKSQREIAGLLNVTTQSLSSVLNAQDVRSGTIEKIAKVLNKPVSYFYGEDGGGSIQQATATGNYSAASVGGDATVNASNAELQERIKLLQELLAEKERTIKLLLEKRA